MTMPSRMCATDSVASTARSSLRKMSRQRITNIGSMPFANSDATETAAQILEGIVIKNS